MGGVLSFKGRMPGAVVQSAWVDGDMAYANAGKSKPIRKKRMRANRKVQSPRLRRWGCDAGRIRLQIGSSRNEPSIVQR